LSRYASRIDCIAAKKPLGLTISLADAVATGRDALPRDPAPQVQRSANRKTGEANGKKPQLRERTSAFTESSKKEAWRHLAPDAQERIPTSAGRNSFLSMSAFGLEL